MCKSFIESSNIWIIDFLVDLCLPLVDCGGSAVPGVWPQEEQRLAGVKCGFKVAVFGLNLQQLVVKTGQSLVVRRFEGIPTSARVGRCCGGLGTTSEFS